MIIGVLIVAEFAGAEVKVNVEDDIVKAVVSTPFINAFTCVLSIKGKVIEYCVVLPSPV